jgi:hypothetical protein
MMYVLDLPEGLGTTMEYRWRDGDECVASCAVCEGNPSRNGRAPRALAVPVCFAAGRAPPPHCGPASHTVGGCMLVLRRPDFPTSLPCHPAPLSYAPLPSRRSPPPPRTLLCAVHSMLVRSEVYSPTGDLRVAITRVWVRAPAGHPLARPVEGPAAGSAPPATARATNPVGRVSHATHIPAGEWSGVDGEPVVEVAALPHSLYRARCGRGGVHVVVAGAVAVVCWYSVRGGCYVRRWWRTALSSPVLRLRRWNPTPTPNSPYPPPFCLTLSLPQPLLAPLPLGAAGPGPLASTVLFAPLTCLSMPLTANYSGRWCMSPESVTAFSHLMKAAKLSWQSFKGPQESCTIVHVRCVCAGGGGEGGNACMRMCVAGSCW